MQIVGDEQQAEAAFGAQGAQEGEDLRLGGDVQGAGGLVGQQQPRFGGQRAGDDDALEHAAGEFVRALADPALRVVESDRGEEFDRALPGGPAGRPGPGGGEPLDEEVPDAADRVEGGARVLVDQGHGPGPVGAQLLAPQGEDVAALHPDGAVEGRPRRERAQGGLGGRGLAGTGLADQADDFAARDPEGDLVQDGAGGAGEAEGEAVDVEEHGVTSRCGGSRRVVSRGGVGHGGYLPWASRSAARTPTTLKETTTRAMATPGTSEGSSAPWTTAACPSCTISPQSELGGWAPNPR